MDPITVKRVIQKWSKIGCDGQKCNCGGKKGTSCTGKIAFLRGMKFMILPKSSGIIKIGEKSVY